MAQQKGLIKIKGTIDGLTFLETQDGHQVRKQKRAISKEALLNGDNYARTRENWNEFREGAHASKLIRQAILPALQNCKDGRLVSRLTQEMIKVTKSDPVNGRGQRKVMDGDVTLLKDFNFNIKALLKVTLKLDLVPVIDRVTGKASVVIPAFKPSELISKPSGATHAKIHSMGCEFNFDDEKTVAKYFESDGFELVNNTVPAINIEHSLTPNSTNPLFLLVGIRFYDVVNGIYYPLMNGSFNALSIVETSRP